MQKFLIADDIFTTGIVDIALDNDHMESYFTAVFNSFTASGITNDSSRHLCMNIQT